MKNPKIALVLGGGGSKGFAHIGVIEVLEENNIPIEFIIGSSAGSTVGAFYADNKNIEQTKQILLKAKKSDLLDHSYIDYIKMFYSLSTPIKGQAYENFIFDNMRAKYFSDLKVPLAVVTTDIKTGEKFVIKDGPIAPAIRASSAIPLVIEPVKLYGKTLVDGGVIEPVPVPTAKSFHSQLIIAINISNSPPNDPPYNSIELGYRASWLSYYTLAKTQAELAHINIHPNLSGFGILEDHRKEELYQLGRQAALDALPQIKDKVKNLKAN
ncbi:MAG: patatin-like phospholipase family protein [Rickettsiales bacterium]|jgi:NTE family protein|nr:patatin-like phospholipase family protein [Rickettsiales bacterium]